MKKWFEKIKANPLFQGIGLDDFEKLMGCMGGRVQSFPKDALIILAGNPVEAVGILASGSVQIVREDEEGRRGILAEIDAPGLFGEAFACAGISQSPVTVLAAENCEVLFLHYKRVVSTCPSACCFHSTLIRNMLRILADKNILLNQKIALLSKRTIRQRLLLFFDLQRQGVKRFTIPYSREELAQYLCVDRSALSNELSQMRKEGLLRFEKNTFELL